MSPPNSAERAALDGGDRSAEHTAVRVSEAAGSQGKRSARPAVSPAIHAVALSKRFGDTVAVKSLSLTVERGEVFGFLGPNGAGKTTVVKLLLGLARPSGGEALVLGAPLDRAMFLGPGHSLSEAALDRHADEAARAFLAAYGPASTPG